MPHVQDDELALLDQWCAGDRRAGSALFGRYFAQVHRFFSHKVEVDVDDLVQETFLACVRERDRFQRQSSFRTYLFAVARYTLYGHWRKAKRSAQVLDFDEVSVASLSTSAASRLARQDEQARLLVALRELSVEQQLLLELYYWEELERDQLAEVFDVEPATTRSRLFRARQALRDKLAQDGEGTSRGAPVPMDEQLDAWARTLRPADAKVRNARAADDTTGGL
ncbi:MAG: RNA polymerase sigma factor [Myxococcales bacterium]|nr:RNA polymerase sigma factor [Myxococcales bacterium]